MRSIVDVGFGEVRSVDRQWLLAGQRHFLSQTEKLCRLPEAPHFAVPLTRAALGFAPSSALIVSELHHDVAIFEMGQGCLKEWSKSF